jgi:glycosyltransferase involved in cell wall biosynthesis
MSDPVSPTRRVLVIAFYFPPMGLSGVQRTLKFVKYLPDMGWSPTVLTIHPGGYIALDETLLHDLEGKSVTILRTKGAGPGRLFGKKKTVELPREWKRRLFGMISDTLFIPDNKIGWRRKAVAAALAAHKDTPFDLIFATAPPFTDFLIGRELRNKINRPLVIDYRDPWVEYPFKFYPTPYHKWRNVVLERKVIKASSRIITTNRTVKEHLIQRHSFLTYHDIDIIPQGFDPADFPQESSRPRRRQSGDREDHSRMRVTYAGVFWADRVPDHFLLALQELFKEKPKARGRIEARFVGKFRDQNLKLVTRLGLQDAVTVLGYLPHSECVREMRNSDVLWMTVGDDVGSPGKTYEYIGARKPILGLAPDGYLKTTILEAGGTVVSPKDVPGIKAALGEFLERFDKKQLRGPSPEVAEKYDRVTLTRSLSKIFGSLLEV